MKYVKAKKKKKKNLYSDHWLRSVRGQALSTYCLHLIEKKRRHKKGSRGKAERKESKGKQKREKPLSEMAAEKCGT